MKSINLTIEDIAYIDTRIKQKRIPNSESGAEFNYQELFLILLFLINEDRYNSDLMKSGYLNQLKKFKSEFLAQKREYKLNQILKD